MLKAVVKHFVRKLPRKASRRPFRLEALEGRVLLTGNPLVKAPWIPQVGISRGADGVLHIEGDGRADVATVSLVNGQVKVTLDQTRLVQQGGLTLPMLVHAEKAYSPAQVRSIAFSGYAGNDTFRNETTFPAVARGGAGRDTLVGGHAGDSLSGQEGDDTLEGRRGPDLLSGGGGNDTYVFEYTALGALGADSIDEAANADLDTLDFSRVLAGSGVAVNLGSTARQSVHTLNGEPGIQLTLFNALGVENVVGTDNVDYLRGNARPNNLQGRGGNDVLSGLAGNDSLYGGGGADQIWGDQDQAGAGNDRIWGGAGDDQIWGGAGSDVVHGDDGNDVIRNAAGADEVYGDGGNDRLFGGIDQDRLYGGAGRDLLVTIGGGQTDVANGGADTDSFWTDAAPAERTDATPAETAAGCLHRVAGFYRNVRAGVGAETPTTGLYGQNLADPRTTLANVTAANYRSKPLFAAGGPSRDDIDQNAEADCYLLATLAAVAGAAPDHVREMVTELGDGTYAVRFTNAQGVDEYVRVDGDLWTQDGKPVYAGLGREGSTWVAIVEKAWCFYRDDKGDYKSIEYWHEPPEVKHAVYQSFGVIGTRLQVADLSLGQLTQVIATGLASTGAVTISGPGNMQDLPLKTGDNFHSNQHAFTVVAYDPGTQVLTLRNPYATQGPAHDGYFQMSVMDALYYCNNVTMLTIS